MGDLSWWQVVAVPTVIAAMPGIIKIWQWWTTRADRATERAMSATDRRDAALIAERAALSTEQRETFVRVEAERDRALADADRERARRMPVERDRDRGWGLARWWYRLAHDLYHQLRNTQQLAMSLAARTQSTEQLPPWPVFDVPLDMETPIPRTDDPK